jgi:hypothetical protein
MKNKIYPTKDYSKFQLFIANKIAWLFNRLFGWGSMLVFEGRCDRCGHQTRELITFFNYTFPADKERETYLRVFPFKCKGCKKVIGTFSIFRSEHAMVDFNKSIMAKYN